MDSKYMLVADLCSGGQIAFLARSVADVAFLSYGLSCAENVVKVFVRPCPECFFPGKEVRQ